jgi:hypothetical protein
MTTIGGYGVGENSIDNFVSAIDREIRYHNGIGQSWAKNRVYKLTQIKSILRMLPDKEAEEMAGELSPYLCNEKVLGEAIGKYSADLTEEQQDRVTEDITIRDDREDRRIIPKYAFRLA